jgi:hypothetical protein
MSEATSKFANPLDYMSSYKVGGMFLCLARSSFSYLPSLRSFSSLSLIASCLSPRVSPMPLPRTVSALSAAPPSLYRLAFAYPLPHGRMEVT